MNQIHIERIPAHKLYEFAENAQADTEPYRILPIPLRRALAQSKNPLAEPDDTGLIAAYYEDKCIGYLGIVPCQLRRGGQLYKIHALSAFYVDEAFRSLKAAAAIMGSAIDMHKDLLLAGFTPSAEKFYLRNPQWFERTVPLKYVRIRLRPISAIINKLKSRIPLLNSACSIDKCIDKTVSPGIGYHLLRPQGRGVRIQLEARPVSAVRPPDTQNISLLDPQAFFYRSPDIVNWMIKYPWITEDTSLQLNYRFSYKERLFRYLPFELYDRNTQERIGYVVLSIKTAREIIVMKILDTVLSDQAYLPCILDLALKEASRWKADVMEASCKFLPYISTNPALRILTQTVERGNFLHLAPDSAAFANHLHLLNVDICDGDQAFF